ncbi:putative bifunctional diguanylate cyclase/phosphodiesterase [Paenibacillus sp. strain BS8-2]
MNSNELVNPGTAEHSGPGNEIANIKFALDVSSIVAITDAKGVITYANDKFCELSQYTKEELIGNTHRIVNARYHPPKFFQDMWSTIASGKVWTGEVRNRAKDGSYYWVKTVIVPFLRDNQPYQYVSIRTDITEHKRDQELIRHIADHDALTGLYNRHSFQEQLTAAVMRAEAEGRRITVLFIDLDRFKFVNDSLGQMSGDLVLREAARRLLACMRPQDTASRLGGDEFAVLLPDLEEEQAMRLTAVISSKLSEPYILGQQEALITASIGVSQYPESGSQAELLLTYADAAMHQAKQEGAGMIKVFSTEMRASFERGLELEAGLHEALGNDEFVLHYQPQYDSVTGRITALEALVRWKHPHAGLVSPAEFIPVAESTGLIVPIGQWVMRAAFEQVKQWQSQGLPLVKIAVNISALQFQSPGFAEELAQMLAEIGLEPRFVELELTESIAMQDEQHSLDMMKELNSRGISIAMDDFGTGYSSLSYLKKFPLQTIKIDRSFISDITRSEANLAIVKTIIELARILKFEVIAEGAETEEQVALLREQGCCNLQGYYYSRPMSAEEMEKLLRSTTGNNG